MRVRILSNLFMRDIDLAEPHTRELEYLMSIQACMCTLNAKIILILFVIVPHMNSKRCSSLPPKTGRGEIGYKTWFCTLFPPLLLVPPGSSFLAR